MMSCKHVGAFLMSLSLLAGNAMATAPVAGDQAPEAFGRTIGGETPKLADFPGKVVVISFWATWCGYCRKELPVLEGLQKAAKKSIQVIAIDTESRDEFRETAHALRDVTMKMTYDADDKGATAYGVHGIPHLVVIGRDGKIIQVYRGYGESMLPEIVAAINAAIAVPAPAAAVASAAPAVPAAK
jgi:thiol-disulfide isomerase/thioredoxin